MEKLKTKLKNWKKSIEYHWNSLPVKTQRNYIAVLFMLYVLMTLALLGSGEKLEERVKKLNVSNHGNK